MLRWILLSGLMLVAGAAEVRPDLLIVTIDTLRRDHLGCYGSQLGATPRIDALAREGVVLERVVAAGSWTLPSMGTFFTGLPPSLHGLISTRSHLSNVPLLAERLRAAGYQTAAVVANPLMHSKSGIGRGFELYDDYTVPFALKGDPLDDLVIRHSRAGAPTGHLVNRVATGWLQRVEKDKPFCLFLLYFDPHADYCPPQPFDRQFTDPTYQGDENGRDVAMRSASIATDADRRHLRGLYAGEVAYADACLGEMLDALDRTGRAENTLVMVLSDHGEEFWEHGRYGHGHSVHGEVIDVPVVVRWPGHIKPGTRVGALLGHADLAPALLTAAKVIDRPASHDVLGLIEGRPGRGHDRVLSESEGRGDPLLGSRSHAWSVMWNRESGRVDMYHLLTDPLERTNLSGSPPPEAQLMLDHLKRWWDEVSPRRAALNQGKPLPLDPALVERLRSLGYFH